jgi:hypothetical protein
LALVASLRKFENNFPPGGGVNPLPLESIVVVVTSPKYPSRQKVYVMSSEPMKDGKKNKTL